MAMKTPEVNATSTADIAFLLLCFFLVSTTMNTDAGLFRRLPPMPAANEVAPKVNKRNIMTISINMHDAIAVGGIPTDVSQLRKKTLEFILNPQNRADLPEKEMKEIDIVGQAMVSKGVISLRSDRGTSYKKYLEVQDVLTSAYGEARDIKSREHFGRKYEDLTTDEQESIRKIVPTSISEAEPKNIGGK